MFENFPGLRGKYLTYRGYFALVFVVSSLLQAVLALAFYFFTKYMLGRGKQQGNKQDETSLLLTSMRDSEANMDTRDSDENINVDGDVDGDKERMSQMTERLVDDINSRISSVTLSKANATTRIFQVCMLLQSPIMFVLVSLLSFGGGGKPVLLILIACSVWLVVRYLWLFQSLISMLVITCTGAFNRSAYFSFTLGVLFLFFSSPLGR